MEPQLLCRRFEKYLEKGHGMFRRNNNKFVTGKQHHIPKYIIIRDNNQENQKTART
jgi:hypothetical protein